MSILIDAEFKALIPPLSADEYAQLEQNCIKDGIRDALVVWKRPECGNILIDGHNRYQIAQENSLDFRTEEMEFEDRDAAKIWIGQNQLGRRNLNNYVRSTIVLWMKPLIAKKSKDKEHERKTTRQNSDKSTFPTIDTKEELAKLAGVSHDTIHRVETLERDAAPEIKEELKSGKKSINKAYTELQKVKAIEESGNEYLKQQVKDGKTTIDQAYRVVTDTQDKTPSKLQREHLDAIKQEHRDFKEKKTDKIVQLSDVLNDEHNKKIIANDVYVRALKVGDRIDDFFFDIKEDGINLDELIKEWSDEEINEVDICLSRWIKKLWELKGIIGK